MVTIVLSDHEWHIFWQSVSLWNMSGARTILANVSSVNFVVKPDLQGLQYNTLIVTFVRGPQAKKLDFFFSGATFHIPLTNLQHWTGFYIAVYGDFQGLFFSSSRALFLHFGGEIAQSPRVIFPWPHLKVVRHICKLSISPWNFFCMWPLTLEEYCESFRS